jgi:uncharacterized tellurite resistance protein B-like protein
MSLLRFLGLGNDAADRNAEPESLIEIGKLLEALPPEEARLAAAFAYLLARVAGADLRIEETERASIAERLETFGEMSAEQSRLLADTAVRAAELHGASDDHLVARAFRDMTDHGERLRLLKCLYAVAAADETLSTVEDNEIFEVATAIGASRSDVISVRSGWKDYLGTMKALRSER